MGKPMFSENAQAILKFLQANQNVDNGLLGRRGKKTSTF